jgi:hypothetical protein
MSFATDQQSDLDALLAAGEFGESIRYRYNKGPISDPFNAFVTEGSLGESAAGSILIGFTAESGKEPLVVTVSKTDVPQVRELIDTVEWNGTTYSVKRVIGETVAGRKLYCVK